MENRKAAIITGGARGIGNGIAKKLYDDGFSITLLDVFNKEDAKEGINNVGDDKSKILYIQGDITKKDSREECIKRTIEKFGRIDVLVNNAGVAPKKRMDMLETTEESMDFVLGINLKGTFFMSQQVANKMIKDVKKYGDNKPVIVNISSMSAYTSSTKRPEYCISKAAVSMITTLFADRLAEYPINVYEIRPGIIYTDMTKTVKDKYDKLIDEGITPIKRWGYPKDIANAVSVLCSGKLGFSTGEVINVDGGFHIRRL